MHANAGNRRRLPVGSTAPDWTQMRIQQRSRINISPQSFECPPESTPRGRCVNAQ
jgi:hypothetical protein